MPSGQWGKFRKILKKITLNFSDFYYYVRLKLDIYWYKFGIELFFNNFVTSISGMHNIRPAGHMWPAEAFYMARKPQIFALSDQLFDKNTL